MARIGSPDADFAAIGEQGDKGSKGGLLEPHDAVTAHDRTAVQPQKLGRVEPALERCEAFVLGISLVVLLCEGLVGLVRLDGRPCCIDGELLKSCGAPDCGEDDIVELANGCLCCTVADDFLPTLQKLLERPQPPTHIVIETSGLALPKPLVQAFAWPGIKTRTTVDGVITVVDAAAVAEGRFADDEDALAQQRAADSPELPRGATQ